MQKVQQKKVQHVCWNDHGFVKGKQSICVHYFCQKSTYENKSGGGICVGEKQLNCFVIFTVLSHSSMSFYFFSDSFFHPKIAKLSSSRSRVQCKRLQRSQKHFRTVLTQGHGTLSAMPCIVMRPFWTNIFRAVGEGSLL